MTLTFIVTIDPVKDVSIMNVLVHSLNLQTSKGFNVIFNNQTLMNEKEIFSKLSVKPAFDYQVFNIEPECFLGKYPIWDLYAFHSFLLDQAILNDYSMCLHMEEFLDVDYVENAMKVLDKNGFDIMFGNLMRTQKDYGEIKSILAAETAEEFNRWLKEKGIKEGRHWTFDYILTKDINVLKQNALKLFYFRFRKSIKPTDEGYTRLGKYVAEDLYFMKKDFSKRYNWFLKGHSMYFEDIHICEEKGVCELSRELKKITEFPIYFNLRRAYHIEHERYYFQLLDNEFTELMLRYEKDDPILNALREAINMYRQGKLNLEQALTYTRRNPRCTGTQNLNYKYHMKYLNNEEQK